MANEAHILFERLLPESLEAQLAHILGESLPRRGEGGRYRIASCGRFSGKIAADLLAYVRNQKYDGAFVLLQDDVVRVLYVQRGLIVGADSNVLFERLGRVLLRAGTLDRESARHVVTCEEQRGLAAAVALLPPDAVQWGLEKRAWEIGTALYFMGGAYFVFVDGEPLLGNLPRLSIPPMDVAIEGLRRYDEWRHGSASHPAQPGRPSPRPEEESDEELAASKSAPQRRTAEADPRDVDEIMRLLRE